MTLKRQNRPCWWNRVRTGKLHLRAAPVPNVSHLEPKKEKCSSARRPLRFHTRSRQEIKLFTHWLEWLSFQNSTAKLINLFPFVSICSLIFRDGIYFPNAASWADAPVSGFQAQKLTRLKNQGNFCIFKITFSHNNCHVLLFTFRSWKLFACSNDLMWTRLTVISCSPGEAKVSPTPGVNSRISADEDQNIHLNLKSALVWRPASILALLE